MPPPTPVPPASDPGERVARLVAAYDLEPHPEGGYFRRTWAHAEEIGGRPRGSAIVYLLGPGDRSHWHRFDAVELWHLYEGGPLRLSVSADGASVTHHVLGADVTAGQVHQVAVPAGVWMAAATVDPQGYAFVGCTVTPAFDPERFELAPPGWEPG